MQQQQQQKYYSVVVPCRAMVLRTSLPWRGMSWQSGPAAARTDREKQKIRGKRLWKLFSVVGVTTRRLTQRRRKLDYDTVRGPSTSFSDGAHLPTRTPNISQDVSFLPSWWSRSSHRPTGPTSRLGKKKLEKVVGAWRKHSEIAH